MRKLTILIILIAVATVVSAQEMPMPMPKTAGASGRFLARKRNGHVRASDHSGDIQR